MEAIAIRLEAIAIRLETMASRMFAHILSLKVFGLLLGANQGRKGLHGFEEP